MLYKKKKECEVRMLPTEEISHLGFLTKKGKEEFHDLRFFDKKTPNILDSENQNLFFLIQDKIKIGDYIMDLSSNKIYKSYEIDLKDNLVAINPEKNNWINLSAVKKIIASTEASLIFSGIVDVPLKFLKLFAKNFTKGTPITQVMVEFEEYHGTNRSIAEIYAVRESDYGRDYMKAFNEKLDELGREYKLKLDKDNCVVISSADEELYEEFIAQKRQKEKIEKALRDFRSECLPFGEYPDYVIIEFLNNWFPKNL